MSYGGKTSIDYPAQGEILKTPPPPPSERRDLWGVGTVYLYVCTLTYPIRSLPGELRRCVFRHARGSVRSVRVERVTWTTSNLKVLPTDLYNRGGKISIDSQVQGNNPCKHRIESQHGWVILSFLQYSSTEKMHASCEFSRLVDTVLNFASCVITVRAFTIIPPRLTTTTGRSLLPRMLRRWTRR